MSNPTLSKIKKIASNKRLRLDVTTCTECGRNEALKFWNHRGGSVCFSCEKSYSGIKFRGDCDMSDYGSCRCDLAYGKCKNDIEYEFRQQSCDVCNDPRKIARPTGYFDNPEWYCSDCLKILKVEIEKKIQERKRDYIRKLECKREIEKLKKERDDHIKKLSKEFDVKMDPFKKEIRELESKLQ